jgi:hypothetical protein
MSPILNDILVAVGVVLLLLLALEAGYRVGVWRAREEDGRAAGQIGAVQGALLGLLGLLLAFSFSAAGSRFLERQDLITQEANAIGTAFLRADLIPEPHCSELRSSLREYTAHRIEVSKDLRAGLLQEHHEQIGAFHQRMWRAARDGARAAPESIEVVVPAVNAVIDFHSTRVAAGKKHLPVVVMGLLVACSLLSIGVIGYGCGTGKRRRPALTGPLALLIGAALWITIDLDHPRAGILRLNDGPLVALDLSGNGE